MSVRCATTRVHARKRRTVSRLRGRPAWRLAPLALCASLALAACGGGSSSSSTTSSSTPQVASATATTTSITATLPALTPARPHGPAYRNALASYAACMRGRGIDIPPPRTRASGPALAAPRNVSTTSKRFQTALAHCHTEVVRIFQAMH